MIFVGGVYVVQQECLNVIVIIVDDMGYLDISFFGGEIFIFNLQVMVEQGMCMSQYYILLMLVLVCLMLFIGNSNQQVGMGGMWWYDSIIGKEGYELWLIDCVIIMVECFKDVGYNILMVGKWYFGFVFGVMLKDCGFNYVFVFMGGGISYFNDVILLGIVEVFYIYYICDGECVFLLDDFYFSEVYVCQMNSWIKVMLKEQLVFVWLVFIVFYDFLQVLDEWIKCFKGQYEQGYVEVYCQCIVCLKVLGIIYDDILLLYLELDKEWEVLMLEQQKYMVKVMQVYVVMIVNMDV